MPANEGDEHLYFMFVFSYQLPESGTILLPWQKSGDGYVPFSYKPSETLTDDNTIYPDAVSMRSLGPGQQFTFYPPTPLSKRGSIKQRSVKPCLTDRCFLDPSGRAARLLIEPEPVLTLPLALIQRRSACLR